MQSHFDIKQYPSRDSHAGTVPGALMRGEKELDIFTKHSRRVHALPLI